MYRHTQLADLGEGDGVVLTAEDGLAEIVTDLLTVDVECRGKLDVADVVPAQIHMHQARDEVIAVGVAIKLHALDQGGSTVAYADDGDANLLGHRTTSGSERSATEWESG